jgi:hypothetical protein
MIPEYSGIVTGMPMEEKPETKDERAALIAKLAANPRFRLIPPTGKGFVIGGAKPVTEGHGRAHALARPTREGWL